MKTDQETSNFHYIARFRLPQIWLCAMCVMDSINGLDVIYIMGAMNSINEQDACIGCNGRKGCNW